MAFEQVMRGLDLKDIKLTGGFWGHWQQILIEETLPQQFEQLEATGRLGNFRRVVGQEGGRFSGYRFNDSDVYKWQEAAAYGLSIRPTHELQSMFDITVKLVSDAQMGDGYINTYFQDGRIDQRLTNLNAMHEMYCIGHLIEAGVAAKECLNDERLLEVSVKCAELLCKTFGPDARLGFCGHEEIELALIKLANCTKETKYRDLARWMVESRGQRPSIFEEEVKDDSIRSLAPEAAKLLFKQGIYSGEYAQDHVPIREHSSVVGHAVRAMYLYIAAAQLARGQNDQKLESALQKCWESLTRKRMYITGGIGPSGDNEGFTHDFDLPNHSAYAETCAAIGLVMWGQSMLESTGNGDFADVIERALYNGVLSGISLDGNRYFYDNPLESRGEHERSPWFPCACCPPNIARIIGSLGKYAAGIAADKFFIHMPIGFDATVQFGEAVGTIKVTSEYPWNGRFEVAIQLDREVTFDLYVRLPDWADEISTEIDGASEEAQYESGYAVFSRNWKPGDTLKVDIEMEPRWMESDPRVRDNLGRTALVNGPLIYCLEERDLGYAPQLFSVDTEAFFQVDNHPRLDQIKTITTSGICDVEVYIDSLYAPIGAMDTRESSATFIPFFAWNNRGKNSMQVWIRHL